MTISFVPREKGKLNLPLIYLLIFGILAVTGYGLFRLHEVPVMLCPFKQITGYPCPTCGSTRLVMALFRGDLVSAFLSNPGLFVSGTILSLWFGYGIFSQLSGKRLSVKLSSAEVVGLKIVLVVLVLLNWIYLILAGI